MPIHDDHFASFQLLEKALEKHGYTATVTTDKEVTTVTYEGPHGQRWTTRAAHISYPFNSETVREISINKQKAYEFAAQNNFPAPYSLAVSGVASKETANALFERFGSLIVKPLDASLARGLTLNITTYDQLTPAIAAAREYSPTVLVQEQVRGEELRFMVVNGKVRVVLLRRTARVVGDGVSTIKTLIARENEERKKIQLEYITYPQLDETIIDPRLLGSQTIPAVGEVVELSHSTMVRGGCSIYDVIDRVDPTYIRAVEKLVQKLGAGFVVADVFCADFTRPAATGSHWLIEFNTAPVLKLCYACRDGKQFDIASVLADEIDRYLTGVSD